MRLDRLLVFASLLLAACYSPSILPGAQQCADDGRCPEGLKCFPDKHCYPPEANPTCTDKCTGMTPVCDKTTLKCVGCLADGDCPGGYVCASNVKLCKPGCNAKHLACAPDAGSCDVDAGMCRGCLTDDECAGDQANPRCDAANGRCVPCLTSNDNCGDGQYCDNSGGNFRCSPGCKSAASCAAPDGGGPIECCKHACVDLQSDLENCGACGTACPMGNACCTGGCVDISSDVANCGGCGAACNPANAIGPRCAAGACDYTDCAPGFSDCDGNRANGCEANTKSDVRNCGGCNMVCAALPNAGAACANSMCVLGPCNQGFADCNGQAKDGCEADTRASLANCGACNKACAPANATGLCLNSICSIASCNMGFANCDNTAANGCESNIAIDPKNCGSCGKVCSFANAGANCVNSACVLAPCIQGFGDCDMVIANGCEVSTTTDVKNCGSCGKVCSFANAAASCANSACVLGACNANFGNCDAVATNGCESSLLTDVKNCGACGKACGANQVCTNGACACATGFGDCDAMAANGCEVNLLTDVKNCGACARACTAANGVPGCAAGACTVASCNAGFGNCDAQVANGCEATLASDAKNCGVCGKVCAVATPNCVNSACVSGFPHHTGLGQTWTDNIATGTLTQSQAARACQEYVNQALGGMDTCVLQGCGCGGNNLCVYNNTANPRYTWFYNMDTMGGQVTQNCCNCAFMKWD